jgi:hypothetical protein
MVISAKTAWMVTRIKRVKEKNVVNISQRREKGEGGWWDGGFSQRSMEDVVVNKEVRNQINANIDFLSPG